MSNAEDIAANLAETCEGFSGPPYQDPAGVWTFGFGSTRDFDGSPVTANTPPITRQMAKVLLERDMRSAFNTIRADVRSPITDDEEAALADFIYNLGSGNFAASTLLRKLNAGDYLGAAAEFEKWDRAGGKVLAGLMRRRAAEAALFGGSQQPGNSGEALGNAITARLNAEEAAIGPDNPGPIAG